MRRQSVTAVMHILGVSLVIGLPCFENGYDALYFPKLHGKIQSAFSLDKSSPRCFSMIGDMLSDLRAVEVFVLFIA